MRNREIMNKRILFLVAAFSILVTHGQTQTKTSKPAKSAQAAKVASGEALSEMVLQGKIPEAVRLASKSPATAGEALNKLMASADAQIALRKHTNAQETLEAAQKFLEACDKARGFKDLPREALRGRQFRLQGIQLSNEKDFAKAEAFLRQALQVSKELKDPAFEAGVHNNLGYALENMDLMEEAAKEYETASKMAEEQKDNLRGGLYNFNWGTVLRKLKRLEPALAAFNRAADQNKAAGQTDIEARAILMQAVVTGAIDSHSLRSHGPFPKGRGHVRKTGRRSEHRVELLSPRRSYCLQHGFPCRHGIRRKGASLPC